MSHKGKKGGKVSTHSRLKAAAWQSMGRAPLFICFNTQPPEGGCAINDLNNEVLDFVSTHSRLKAAAHTV